MHWRNTHSLWSFPQYCLLKKSVMHGSTMPLLTTWFPGDDVLKIAEGGKKCHCGCKAHPHYENKEIIRKTECIMFRDTVMSGVGALTSVLRPTVNKLGLSLPFFQIRPKWNPFLIIPTLRRPFVLLLSRQSRTAVHFVLVFSPVFPFPTCAECCCSSFN